MSGRSGHSPAAEPLGAKPGLDPVEFRQCLGAFVTGVTVITTLDGEGTKHGLTANSFNSVSLDPPLILWSLRLNARSFPVFSQAERFVVNILAEDQVEISNRFARPAEDRFAGLAIAEGIGGLPMIVGCAAHLECRKETTYPGGDHMVFLGRVERITNTRRKPLAFGSGRYMVVHPHDLGPLSSDDPTGNVASLRALRLARPVLEELGRETHKAIALSVWGNRGPTVVWWAEGGRPLDVRLRCGLVVPVSRSATGLVFAAFSPPELTEPLLRGELAEDERGGAPIGVARQRLEAILEDVRRNKLGSAVQAVRPDADERAINAFSAPVFDGTGSVVLAMTMVGDARSFDAGDPAVGRLSDAAAGLSRRLGHPSPQPRTPPPRSAR